jgi:arylsulfatase A-like enzyme
MTSRTAVSGDARSSGSQPSELTGKRPGLVALLFLSAWCGVVAGLLEVGAIVVRKEAFDSNRLYWMSRHFVWLIPLVNLGIFLALGCFGTLVCIALPQRGRWLLARVLCALTILPVFLVGFPRVYTVAFLAMALGVAARLVPAIERRARAFRRIVLASALPVVGIVLVLAASPWVDDWIKQSRERSRRLPPSGSPNVLLIVLDTVAAGHLSLYGYERPTSTTLVELAEQGIRFDSLIANSSWTLPSHATMFTGRWLHELSVGWLNPLDTAHSTLAEFLGARGYATAGFIANMAYCASDSGLGRGFTVYEDYIFPELTALKTAVLANRVLRGLGSIVPFVETRPALARWHPYVQRLWRSLTDDRKRAAVVNRELLNWLARREQPDRPFFAFLNYSDAHTPYELPPGRMHRFGVERPDERQRELISHWADLDKARLVRTDLPFVVDAYDDCIADLDEQLGKLIDELRRRGVLERTWLVIASDHGESFGEHAGVFCHGTSLYQTELHVPLVIVPPGGSPKKQVIPETVSLRELPATTVDLVDLEAGSPFPGVSLARYWDPKPPAVKPACASSDPAVSELVPGDARYRDAYGLPLKTWPMGALNEGEWSYIRSEGKVREELFHLRRDAKEQRNLARDPASQPVLNRMRDTLSRLTGGPLEPRRFNR